jgi:hypothetical protein
MQNHHELTQLMTATWKALWVSLILVLTGCSGVDSEGGTNLKRMSPDSDFVLRFSSEGGFGDMFVEVNVKRGGDNPLSVSSRIGKRQPVQKDYASTDLVAKKVDAIMTSGVFDLPAENRKQERAGRDLAHVKIVYHDARSDKAIIRDYRWGETFEPSFHQAEQLFGEIAKIVGETNP